MSIVVNHISKHFTSGSETIQAVKDVTLEIEQGEFYTLLGPSGCGKTTLLRCIAGLETPDLGEVVVEGQVLFSHLPPKCVPAYERNIGMVFQSYAIWPHMSVFDNVAYPLRYGINHKFTKAEIRNKVMASLARVHMDKLEDRAAPQLSGGQQQRVALARALAIDPKAILLDEPLGNLDAKLREEMRVELRDLLHGLGTTVVYVTHDQVEALSMSDRIAVLLNGQVVQEGTPTEIYCFPKTDFVASFVGTNNLIRGMVKRHQFSPHEKILETRMGAIQFQCEGIDIAEGQEVEVAIRPEDVQISRSNESKQPNTFHGKVKRSQFLGESLVAYIEIGGETLQVRVHPSQKLEAGESVQVLLSPAYCRLLAKYAGSEKPT